MFKRNYEYTYNELLEIIDDYFKYTLDDDMPNQYEYIEAIIYDSNLSEKEKEELYFNLNNI